MTFEDFYRLNKDQLERLLEADAYKSMVKLAWNEGFRMGYGASYFLPRPGCPYQDGQKEKIIQKGIDQTGIQTCKGD